MIDLYHLGREAFSEGRYEEAERFFLKLLDLDCRFADVLNMLGVTAFEVSDYDAAEKRFREALEINPRYTEAGLNLAVTLNERGDYASGEAAFRRASSASLVEQGAVDPYVKGRLSNLHADIGEIYHGLGLHEDAVTEYRKALNLGPGFPDLRVRLGILFRDMGEYEKAIEEFTRTKLDHPRYPAAGIQLGITYYSRGQTELAIDEWKSILEKDPGNAKALMYLRLAEKDQA
jgi:tetratricopeptide (TPR) repeat protein